MKTNQICETIKLYDKNNNLVSFIEYENSEIKSYYKVFDNILFRKFSNKFTDGTSEIMSSIINYSENVRLFPLCIDGEICMKIISSSNSSFYPVNINNRIDTRREDDSKNSGIEMFTIKTDLISEWKNKH